MPEARAQALTHRHAQKKTIRRHADTQTHGHANRQTWRRVDTPNLAWDGCPNSGRWAPFWNTVSTRATRIELGRPQITEIGARRVPKGGPWKSYGVQFEHDLLDWILLSPCGPASLRIIKNQSQAPNEPYVPHQHLHLFAIAWHRPFTCRSECCRAAGGFLELK